jgi:N utilization substance protein B
MTAARKPANPIAAKRHKARHYAMQALYQWHMAGASLNDIEAEFREEYDFANVDGDYFHCLLHDIPARLDAIEAAYAPLMVERSLEELDPIERALLRIATYELMERIEVPYKVVINEAVNLAKKFGATDSHKFINGVLDQAARQLRSLEVTADSRS